MRLGLFGGSFNPPHLGHLAAAQFFFEAMRLDQLLVIPAKQAPLKPTLYGAADADRLELCHLTFPYSVSDIELRREGISYTIDTLRELQSSPGAQCFLLIGTDQLKQLRRWHCWQELLERCTVCALQRSEEALCTDLPVQLLRGFKPMEISSTEIRSGIAKGEDMSPWLTPAAWTFIREKGLYAA